MYPIKRMTILGWLRYHQSMSKGLRQMAIGHVFIPVERMRGARLVLSAILLTSLSACGGGGGGGTNSTPTPPAPPVTTNYNTSEYQRSRGSVRMDALSAYNQGATGQNVTVGIIDTGINTTSPEFSGRISTASRDVTGSRSVSDFQDVDEHGTAVAAIIGAARNDVGIMGVAFNSNLLVLRADAPGTCGTSTGCEFFDTAIAQGINVSVANNARVINISLGGGAGGGTFRNAVDNATANGKIVVISAGNDGAVDPDAFALIANDAVARGLVIIAGSHDLDGTTLSSFSNKAGIGQNYYLAALGSNVATIDENGVDVIASGTSFSAPHISGAIALLAQAFPNLTGAQIVDLLYTSAIDLGDVGADAIYGRGKLSLTRAFQPQGRTSLALSATSPDGVAVSLTNNGMLSAPMGDSALQGQALSGTVFLDGYGRAYQGDLSRTLGRAPQSHRLVGSLMGQGRSFAANVGGAALRLSFGQREGDGQRYLHSSADQQPLTPEGYGFGSGVTRARATAATVIGRISPRTQMAFGFSQIGSDLARQFEGGDEARFLLANSPLSTPGFDHRAGQAFAIRHERGSYAFTVTAESGDAIGWSPERLDKYPYRMVGALATHRGAHWQVGIGAGLMDEQATMLGGVFGPAFGVGGARTYLIDGQARMDFGPHWTVAGQMRQGWTQAQLSGGLATGGVILSRSFAVDVMGKNLMRRGDRLGLRMSQPLRVEGGGLRLMVPVDYDYASRTATLAARQFGLSPNGREIDLEANYGVRLLGGWIDTNLFWRRQPGHIAAQPHDVGMAVRYGVQF